MVEMGKFALNTVPRIMPAAELPLAVGIWVARKQSPKPVSALEESAKNVTLQ